MCDGDFVTETDQPVAHDYAAMRHAMVISQLRPNAVTSVALLEAMGRVPREAFVPTALRTAAYTDRSVPLGRGRAINPALTTARLIDAAGVTTLSNVLIVGAATGYAVAVVASMGASVSGVESDAALAMEAMGNVPDARIVEGPLAEGVPDGAPYDCIVVDGAVEAVPPALIAQLTTGGRLAAGIIEQGVSRLAVGRRGGSGFAMIDFADAEAVALPGFSRPKAFVF